MKVPGWLVDLFVCLFIIFFLVCLQMKIKKSETLGFAHTTKRGEKLILRGCFCGSLAGQDKGALMAAQKGVKAAWMNKRGKEGSGDEDGQVGHFPSR